MAAIDLVLKSITCSLIFDPLSGDNDSSEFYILFLILRNT